MIGLHVKLTILGECDVASTTILGMLMSNYGRYQGPLATGHSLVGLWRIIVLVSWAKWDWTILTARWHPWTPIRCQDWSLAFDSRSLKPGGTIGYPAQPGLICFSVCNSVHPSVRAKRGIWSKRVFYRKIGSLSFSVRWRNTTIIHYFLLA